jgi:anti-anti-sigma factor
MNDSVIVCEEFGDVMVLRIISPSMDSTSILAIAAACTAPRPITVIDFADVAFINSKGISALLDFAVSARRSGANLFAINVSPHHRRVFKVGEVTRFLTPIDDAELVVHDAAFYSNGQIG